MFVDVTNLTKGWPLYFHLAAAALGVHPPKRGLREPEARQQTTN
jgi:hypothetical protein